MRERERGGGVRERDGERKREGRGVRERDSERKRERRRGGRKR